MSTITINCAACQGDIEFEKDGKVSLPCGHTFHPTCYLTSFNDNEDELPNDFVNMRGCVLCVLNTEKIINDKPADDFFNETERNDYNMRRAQVICAHNKIYIKRTETANDVVNLLWERHGKSLRAFTKVARRYGSARWKLEKLIYNKRKEIIKTVKEITEFTIKRMSDKAYKEICESELYKDFVIRDKEYVKSLNSLEYIDPIQYFNESVTWFLTKRMAINPYTWRLVHDDMLAKQIPALNRSTIKGRLRLRIV
jgi:hypothetical protein